MASDTEELVRAYIEKNGITYLPAALAGAKIIQQEKELTTGAGIIQEEKEQSPRIRLNGLVDKRYGKRKQFIRRPPQMKKINPADVVRRAKIRGVALDTMLLHQITTYGHRKGTPWNSMEIKFFEQLEFLGVSGNQLKYMCRNVKNPDYQVGHTAMHAALRRVRLAALQRR